MFNAVNSYVLLKGLMKKEKSFVGGDNDFLKHRLIQCIRSIFDRFYMYSLSVFKYFAYTFGVVGINPSKE